MRFFKRKEPLPEQRDGPYTDAIVQQIINERTTAAASDAHNTAALEAAAGVIGRAFGSVKVMSLGGTWAPATPEVMMNIGRDLVIHGQAVVVPYGGEIIRASSWDVMGKEPSAWTYRVEIPSPDGNRTLTRGVVEVAHPKWSSHPSRPWVGVGPLQHALSAAELMGNMESRMAQEAAMTVGHILPIPSGGDSANVTNLKSDLGQLKGKLAVVETTHGGWGEGRSQAPQQDWQAKRIGPTFPESHKGIYTAAQIAIMAACGVPVELINPADGGGMREAWRRCLHGTLEPLGRVVAHELSKIAPARVELDFSPLFASDITGRARAFQSLVGGGLDPTKAAALSGLMEE